MWADAKAYHKTYFILHTYIRTRTRAPLCLASHTFCWREGVSPCDPQTTGPISKIQAPFDSPVPELSKHGVKFDLEVTDDVPGRVKVGMFDILGLVTSASKILMLSANKANESAWIVSLTSVDCKYHFLCFMTITQVKAI